MTTDEVRKKYIEFFVKRGHVEISPSPLIPAVNTGTLFTPFGMQQMVPYLLGEEHPLGTKLVDSQPCIRVDDIEEVGDNRHTTFFEMLGNWSLGDYFKEEQLNWFFHFLIDKQEGLGLDPERLYVSVFSGHEDFKVRADGELKNLAKDVETIGIWKKIFASVGIDAKEGERIKAYPAKKNWWSMNGEPENMPVGDIGGPDSEVFYDYGVELKLHEHSSFKDEECHQNCDCGRFVELGNSVFMQYRKVDEHIFEELPKKNVDFGGGLERLVAATNNNPNIFAIDIFEKAISLVEEFVNVKYGESEKTDRSFRIITDHLRAASYLAAQGIIPSNKLQGYILRRLIRRAVFNLRNLGFSLADGAISTFSKSYSSDYEVIANNWPTVKDILDVEAIKFSKALERGLAKLKKALENKEDITGQFAFDLYQNEGFPLELTLEILEKEGKHFSDDEKNKFADEFKKHQKVSRSASAGVFKGGLADHSQETTQLHTATHLLHTALRKVLGEHVTQKGSNITQERLRFDFTHDQKLSDEDKQKIEELINEQIDKKLPVSFDIMTLEEARHAGALAFFGDKYGEKVKVYTVGDPAGDWFSKEVCGGSHVTNLSQIQGHVRIKKEESVSSGVRRIYATIESK